MTNQEYDKMTDESQLIKIATLNGWRRHTNKNGIELWYNVNHPGCRRHFVLPDYLNDLNVMYESEMGLSNVEYDAYLDCLISVCAEKGWARLNSATAKMRAKAFTIAITKLKESKSIQSEEDTDFDLAKASLLLLRLFKEYPGVGLADNIRQDAIDRVTKALKTEKQNTSD